MQSGHILSRSGATDRTIRAGVVFIVSETAELSEEVIVESRGRVFEPSLWSTSVVTGDSTTRRFRKLSFLKKEWFFDTILIRPYVTIFESVSNFIDLHLRLHACSWTDWCLDTLNGARGWLTAPGERTEVLRDGGSEIVL